MNLVEERLRRLMVDVTETVPAVPDRAMALQRRIRRRRRTRVVSVAVLAAIAVISASAGLVDLQSRRVAHNAQLLAASSTPGVRPGGNHVAVVGAKNILLIRIDGRPSTGSPVRADSVVLLHIPATHDHGWMLSIPTSTLVAVPAYDNGAQRYPGGQEKLGAAFAIGAGGLDGAEARQHGTQLLARTIEGLARITVDATAVTDYAGYEQVLNALGGVDMYVDEQTASIDVGYDSTGREAAPYRLNPDGTVGSKTPGVRPQVYEVGQQHLAAWQALDYTRQRDLLANNDGDYGQARHEQQLLQAVIRKMLANGPDPVKLDAIMNTISNAATIDTGGISLGDWFHALWAIGGNNLVGIQMNGGRYNVTNVPGVGTIDTLSQTSIQLLRAVHDDAVDTFIVAHPDWVALRG